MLFESIRYQIRMVFLMVFRWETYLEESYKNRLAIETLADMQRRMQEDLELARLYNGLRK